MRKTRAVETTPAAPLDWGAGEELSSALGWPVSRQRNYARSEGQSDEGGEVRGPAMTPVLLTRPAFLAYHARLAVHYSDLMERQLNAPMAAPAVSATQSCQLDSRNGTKN